MRGLDEVIARGSKGAVTTAPAKAPETKTEGTKTTEGGKPLTESGGGAGASKEASLTEAASDLGKQWDAASEGAREDFLKKVTGGWRDDKQLQENLKKKAGMAWDKLEKNYRAVLEKQAEQKKLTIAEEAAPEGGKAAEGGAKPLTEEAPGGRRRLLMEVYMDGPAETDLPRAIASTFYTSINNAIGRLERGERAQALKNLDFAESQLKALRAEMEPSKD